MNNEFVIYVRGLRKSYGSFEAIKGIDFEVYPGEVFGLLGPNGAGKTSTVEILEGLRPRSAGEVKVLKFDPDRQKQKLKDRIGVCLQATNLPDKITVDVSALNIGDAIHVREIQLPPGVTTRVQPDLNAFSVLAPTVEEEPVVAEVEAAAGPEVIREKKEEPEAAPASGAKEKAAPKEKEQRK